MEQDDRVAALEARCAELEAHLARREAELEELKGDFAALEADFEEHLEACPGKSKVNQRRAKRKAQAARPADRAEGA